MVAQFFEKGDTEKIPETSKSHLDIKSEDTEIEKEQQPETILIQESEHVKGQLISKCLFGVILWTKKTNEIFSRISALASKKRQKK